MFEILHKQTTPEFNPQKQINAYARQRLKINAKGQKSPEFRMGTKGKGSKPKTQNKIRFPMNHLKKMNEQFLKTG
jgi:hypothetical protein